MKTPLGRWTKIRPTDPRAIAVCDYSGMYCRHSDLVKQMEDRGSGLVWTGFLVNKVFADKPNPQLLTPILMPDPIPVNMPRPDTAVDPTPPPANGVYPQNPAPPSGPAPDPLIPGGGEPYPQKGVYKKTKFY